MEPPDPVNRQARHHSLVGPANLSDSIFIFRIPSIFYGDRKRHTWHLNRVVLSEDLAARPPLPSSSVHDLSSSDQVPQPRYRHF